MKFTLNYGEPKQFPLNFNINGVPLDITGATVKAVIVKSVKDAIAAFSKTITEHTDAPNGNTIINITANEAKIVSGDYELWVQISNQLTTNFSAKVADLKVIETPKVLNG